jgi:hypothetical protein
LFELLAMAAALRLPPIEQCKGDPAFDKVRAEFAGAVKARDARRLASLASDDILMDEEGYYKGPASLKELMSGERGPDFWRDLEPIPEGGCTADEDGRALPSFLPRLIGGDEPMIVAGANEPIRAGPEADAEILGHASWEWVDHNFADSGPFYWHVRLRSGRIGYIRSERIYSSFSPYAAFELRDGEWKLVMLRLIPAD